MGRFMAFFTSYQFPYEIVPPAARAIKYRRGGRVSRDLSASSPPRAAKHLDCSMLAC
jgi:hypothetical protein